MSDTPSAASLDALLKFVGDPKNAAKNIAEMKKVADAIEKSRAEHKKQIDDLRAAENKADRLHSDRREELTKRENELRRLDGYSAALDAREAAVSGREKDLTVRMAEHTKRDRDVSERAHALDYKLTELRNSQAALDKRAAKVAEQEADYKERIARLRALAG